MRGLLLFGVVGVLACHHEFPAVGDGPRDTLQDTLLLDASSDRRLDVPIATHDLPADDVSRDRDMMELISWQKAQAPTSSVSCIGGRMAIGGGVACQGTIQSLCRTATDVVTAKCTTFDEVWAACASPSLGVKLSQTSSLNWLACSVSMTILGGFCDCGGDVVISSYPSTNGWTCTCGNIAPVSIEILCAANSNTYVASQPNTPCGKNELLIGGGCNCLSGKLTTSRPGTSNDWTCTCAGTAETWSICMK